MDVCEEKKDLELIDDVRDENWDDEYGNDDMHRLDEMINEVKDQSCEQPRIFESMSEAAENSLYPGCTNYTKLSAVITLFNIKSKVGWPDSSFTSLLEVLADILPDGNEM